MSAFSQPRSFAFRDGFRHLVLSRRSHLPGVDPQWASSLLQQALRREGFLFGQQLASWCRAEKGLVLTDDQRVLEQLLREVALGTVVVREQEAAPGPVYTHQYRAELPELLPEPAPAESIVEDERSLRITACDPVMRPRLGPLRGSYLLRGLAGQAVTLRIVSEALEGRVLHATLLSPEATGDGGHPFEWDGLVTQGAEAGHLVSPNASPLRVELVHDDAYCDEAPVEVRATVHTLELGRVHFHSESAVPSPAKSASELGLIEVARATLRFGSEYPEKRLLIAGHTDTAGSDAFNRELSMRRAEVVRALLTGDRDNWAERCAATASVVDAQRFLAWFAQHYEVPACDPGPLDNDRGPKTRAASRAFRDLYNLMFEGELGVNDKSFKRADWAAVHHVYSDWLAVVLDLPEAELPTVQSRLHWLEPALLGCGETWPLEAVAINNFPSRLNRRVDLLFFDEAEIPDLSQDSRPGESLYGRSNYEALPIDCDPEPNLDGRYFFSI